jgi:hypothetical protein
MNIQQAFAMRRGMAQTGMALAGMMGLGIVGVHAQEASALRPPPKPADEKAMPIKVTVATEKTKYAVGDPIKMTLTVKNTSKQIVPLRFGSGQRYDFILREGSKPDGKVLWQWSRGKMFTMMVSSQPLEMGKSFTYSFTYDPKAAPSKPPAETLKAGTYTLTGTLATLGADSRPSATTQFAVK